MPERIASTVTPPSCQTQRPGPGTLTAMPDDERDDDVTSDDGRVITGFGIGSAALGLLSVAAVVLALIIWSGHRNDVDERALPDRGARRRPPTGPPS